jgi:hypothetical protein
MPYPTADDLARTAETMLYRCPGATITWGIAHEFVTVPDADVDAHLADGWHRTLTEADQAHKDAQGNAVKAKESELQDIGKQLGLKAVHKGRGVWEVQDKDGAVIESGLTKEDAQAKAGA